MKARKTKKEETPASPGKSGKGAVRKPVVRERKVKAVSRSKRETTAPLRVETRVQAVPGHLLNTVITARIDVGFGNALYLRGEGAGLSWDRGLPMDCVGNDIWRITLGESSRGLTFKFLVNDLTWSTGPDYVLPSGGSVELAPRF